jgi:hypothetical protein
MKTVLRCRRCGDAPFGDRMCICPSSGTAHEFVVTEPHEHDLHRADDDGMAHPTES